jgi:hypothetical protein
VEFTGADSTLMQHFDCATLKCFQRILDPSFQFAIEFEQSNTEQPGDLQRRYGRNEQQLFRPLNATPGSSADEKSARDNVGDWPLDTHELNYNFLWQHPESDLIPLLQHLGRGVIAKRPVANAVYLGNLYDQGDEANQMRRKLERFPLGKLAGDIPVFKFVLRFTLSNRAIATAIVGTADPEHVKSNAAISDGNPLSSETLEKVRREYCRGS